MIPTGSVSSSHTAFKRPPDMVMRLSRMGASHATRLSFMRVLLRRLRREDWSFDRPVWRIGADGTGVATYRARGPKRTYTLVAFAHDLPSDRRSDRVIADAWDATFALVDGEIDDEDIERLSSEVPVQEAGRLTDREFVLSRANRSVRVFEHAVDRLSRGEQPDPAVIEPVGYLMRTTAVYGSGKFGAADRDVWAERHEFRGSFQPELLTVWLIRTFSLDLVEHLARMRAPETAVTFDRVLRRRIGVGNSTGLGMAPFLVNHPALIHAWVDARETALARVRAVEQASPEEIARFTECVASAIRMSADWRTDHPVQAQKCEGLRADMDRLAEHLEAEPLGGRSPWDRLYRWAESTMTVEGQELTVALMLEPHGSLIDDLSATMSADESTLPAIDGRMKIAELRDRINAIHGWTTSVDFDSAQANARIWYVSEEKLEPRLGERGEEELEPYEQPLAPGRDAIRLLADLEGWDDGAKIAEFLLRHPEHRHTVRRLQLVSRLPYAEVRDNTVGADMLPIDLLRCKLAFFGATKFDPRSDRWVRITMYQGAPFPDELAHTDPDDPDVLAAR